MLLRSLVWWCIPAVLYGADADLILHHGKIVTLDSTGSVAQAMAFKDGRIARVGTDRNVLAAERGAATRVVDLAGKMVLPGLCDAHVHTLEAGLSEFRSPLPRLDSIAAIQDYIRARARVTPKGAWILVPRTLPPRISEMRLPTRADLDIDRDHPVAFDASYVWSANSLALQVSGITRETPDPPGGEIVKGPDGEPNGILRNADSLLRGAHGAEKFSEDEKLRAIEQMLRLYAAAGLSAVGDRLVTPPDAALFETLERLGRLPIRVILTWRPDAQHPVESIEREIRASPWTTNRGNEMLKFGSFKITLDGGQSVGTAYQRMPYGPFGRQLYGLTDPDARGTLFVDAEKLYRIYSAARGKGWQLTAHVQGGAAIDTLLDVFERLDRETPIAPTRSHVLHGSFLSEEAVARMKRLHVALDAQPGWLYFDVPALERVFGRDHMRWFFPLKSVIAAGIPVAGGSDHMIGHDKDRAINPYNPFFNMWMCVTRRMSNGDTFYPEERISRLEALRMYSSGPAWLQFSEKTRGSLEPGKAADAVVIDRDYFTCPEDEIRSIQPIITYVAGVAAYQRR
jgi:predicted amidohydrolase YtcJ